ncbi:MAG: hypothetical protein PCFJNLEI_04085 [Verrucomicrobiae bacterium]|nr:hypothetical protein [Verrucomicrobiae bacterium]
MIGAKRPECDILRPHYDSGIKWADSNNPKLDDVLWGGGVRAGVTWDGTLYRDLSRYAARGELFWCAYAKSGSGPGEKNGYWFNFGGGWCHLAGDDFSQMLTGAAPRLFWESAAGRWKLVIEATLFVTGAVVNVWTGTKAGGNDPVGEYRRIAGCDPLAAVSVEAG